MGDPEAVKDSGDQGYATVKLFASINQGMTLSSRGLLRWLRMKASYLAYHLWPIHHAEPFYNPWTRLCIKHNSGIYQLMSITFTPLPNSDFQEYWLDSNISQSLLWCVGGSGNGVRNLMIPSWLFTGVREAAVNSVQTWRSLQARDSGRPCRPRPRSKIRIYHIASIFPTKV